MKRKVLLIFLVMIGLLHPAQNACKAETTGKVTFQKEETNSTPISPKETPVTSEKQPSSAEPSIPQKKELPNTGEVLQSGLSLLGSGAVLFISILFWRSRKKEKQQIERP